jgi:transposase-like protein
LGNSIFLTKNATVIVVFKRKQWTAATLNEMLQLYRDGVRIEKLAKKYGVTADAIRQQASKHHVYRSGDHLSQVRREASGLPGVRDE